MGEAETDAGHGTDTGSVPAGATTDSPLAGGRGFDWVMVALSTWWIVGVYLDGRAHTHAAPETFFTVEHAVFYAAFLAILGWLGASVYHNRTHGATGVREALPTGYWLSLVGALVFAVGGVGDMLWHTAFGIEESVEALLSPTHLLLVGGGTLMASGPLRAAWYRRTPRTWRAQAPMVASAAIVLAVLTFVTMFLNPWVFVRARLTPVSPNASLLQAGVGAVVVHTALVMGVVLALVWRFRLVFGVFTVLLGVNALAAAPLGDSYPLIPVAVVAGLAADALYLGLDPSPGNPRAFRTFGLAVPLVLYGLYFAAIELAVGIGWSVHVWAGSVGIAGAVGLAVSYLVVLPDPGVERS